MKHIKFGFYMSVSYYLIWLIIGIIISRFVPFRGAASTEVILLMVMAIFYLGVCISYLKAKIEAITNN